MNSRKNPSLARSFLAISCLTLSLTGCASLFRHGDVPESDEKGQEKSSNRYSAAEGTTEAEDPKDQKIKSLESTITGLNLRVRELETKLDAAQNPPRFDAKLAAKHLDATLARQSLGTPKASVATNDPGAGFSNDASVRSFQQGKALFDQEKYPEAILSFSSFLERDERHTLASNAQYYIAESYFLQGDFVVADQEFQKLAIRYPNSSRLSYALVRLAECSEKTGRGEDARRYRAQAEGFYSKSPALRGIGASALHETMPTVRMAAPTETAAELPSNPPIATAPDMREVAPDATMPGLMIEKPVAPKVPVIEEGSLDALPGAAH